MVDERDSDSMVERSNLQKCRCRQVAVLRTSWTNANPGRRFLGCSKYQIVDGCDFFKWFDRCLPSKIVGLLHNREEAGSDNDDNEHQKKEEKKQVKKEHKDKKFSWIQMFVVLVIGIVIGRVTYLAAVGWGRLTYENKSSEA